MLRIKLVKSPIGQHWRNRRTVTALGLRKVSMTVELPDNPSVRGMIHAVRHMVMAWDGDTLINDARKFREHATRKDKKPSETH